jgi:hypothetical protein
MSNCRARLCLLAAVSVLSSLSFAVTADRITGTVSNSQMAVLQGNVNRKALPQYDQGAVDPGMQMGTITLLTVSTPAQVNALRTLLAQQQTPGSANYHKWLTPEQFADSFGLSPHDIRQITSWLTQQGFTAIHSARGRNWVTFTGTAAQVESAFNTTIHHYNVNGEMHYANANAPSIPAALAAVVTGMRGLDNFSLRPRGVQRKLRPHPMYDSSEWGDLIAPGDIATIYDYQTLINSGNDGTGYKLAVMGQTDVYLADLNDFRSGFNLPSISCTTNSSGIITACSDPHFSYVLNGTDTGSPSAGDLEESDLDLEWSAAVAPGAQTVFVNTPANSGGVFESFYYAIDNDLAPVISLSYGVCELGDPYILTSTGLPGSDETELMEANSEGITFLNSAGDSGVAECDDSSTVTSTNLATQGLAVSYPASSPEVTGVGGTAIPLENLDNGANAGAYWGTSNGTTGGTAKSYIPEENWDDDYEFYQFCQSNSTNGICEGSENGTGISIVSQETAQEVIGIAQGGGGASNCAINDNDTTCVSGFAQPSWQAVSMSGQGSARFSPDVSFLASPNFPGYIFCTPQSELGLSSTTSSCSPGGSAGITNALSLMNGSEPDPSIIGGTSASAPVFAGIVVLLNQALGANGLGNINPMLYTLAANSSSAFHQISTANNYVYCEVGTPAGLPAALQCPTSGVIGYSAASTSSDAVTGFNLTVGLGSVDVNALATAWNAAVGAQSFTLAPTTEALSASAGGNTNSTTINITPANGFSGTVSLACSRGLPAGATCSFTPVNSTSSTLVVQTTSGATGVQNASVVVTGTSGAVSNSTVVSLTVNTPTEGFTLGANPTSANVVAGNTTSPLTLTVTPTNGFTGTVSFACSGLPSGATCAFNPTTVTGGSGTTQVTIATPASAAAGNDTVTITGTSGSTTNNTTVTLAVTGTNQSFTLAIQGGNPQVEQGATANINITVTGANGFSPANSPLTYTCTTTAPEAQCLYPSGATNTSTVSVQVTTTAPTAAANHPANLGPRIFYAALLPGLLGIVFAAGSRKRSLRGMRMLGLMLVLGASTLWLGSCSGSNNSSTGNQGTPVGSYSVTVTATTGGQAPISNNIQFTLNVVQ